MDYSGARKTALSLLNNFGKSVVLTRSEDGGTYDPVSGLTVGGSTLLLNGTGVFLNYKNNEIDGQTIKQTDKKMLFSGDKLSIGDVYNNFTVHDIIELDPDESGTILTAVQLRK